MGGINILSVISMRVSEYRIPEDTWSIHSYHIAYYSRLFESIDATAGTPGIQLIAGKN